jgi:hypothetical protein
MVGSPHTDGELKDWLRWAEAKGPYFLRLIARAAQVADSLHYIMLRPILLELRTEYKP